MMRGLPSPTDLTMTSSMRYLQITVNLTCGQLTRVKTQTEEDVMPVNNIHVFYVGLAKFIFYKYISCFFVDKHVFYFLIICLF